MESGSRYCLESLYPRARRRFRRCCSSVAIVTVDVWLLPWRQVDPFLRGSLADLEGHLCQTFPAAQGLPVHKKKTIFVARITNQFTAIRYSCSGLVWVYKVSSFMQRSEYELKIYLSIYLSRADFDVCFWLQKQTCFWRQSLERPRQETFMRNCNMFFFFLASCINFLTDFPDQIQFETVPHSNASFYVPAW